MRAECAFHFGVQPSRAAFFPGEHTAGEKRGTEIHKLFCFHDYPPGTAPAESWNVVTPHLGAWSCVLPAAAGAILSPFLGGCPTQAVQGQAGSASRPPAPWAPAQPPHSPPRPPRCSKHCARGSSVLPFRHPSAVVKPVPISRPVLARSGRCAAAQ